MKFCLRGLAVSLSLLLVGAHPVGALTKAQTLFVLWDRVAHCEEGGNWHHWSWWYPDALGIDRPNFIAFGGNPNVVNPIRKQIAVAMKFVHYYHIPIPDQHGYCYAY